MHKFVGDYLLLSFVASFGVLLFVTSRGGFRGLLILGKRTSQFVGLALTVVALAWFFIAKPRNIPDTLAGLNGNEQAMLFGAGAVAALVILLTVSSLRNRRMMAGHVMRSLDALRSTTYIHLISQEVRRLWVSWKQQTKRPSSG